MRGGKGGDGGRLRFRRTIAERSVCGRVCVVARVFAIAKERESFPLSRETEFSQWRGKGEGRAGSLFSVPVCFEPPP